MSSTASPCQGQSHFAVLRFWIHCQLCVVAILALTLGSCPSGKADELRRQTHVACTVLMRSGEIRLRPAGNVSWVNLDDREKLNVGDMVYTHPGSFLKLAYVATGATVQLQPQTLFRIDKSPPTYTKQRRRFGVENPLLSQSLPDLNKLLKSAEEPSKNLNTEMPDRMYMPMNIVRHSKLLKLETPAAETTVIAKSIPTSMAVRVDPEFMGFEIWAFLWEESNSLEPAWSAMSAGQFPEVPLEKEGKYRLQVMTDDEAYVSASINIEVTRSQGSLARVFKSFESTKRFSHTVWLE